MAEQAVPISYYKRVYLTLRQPPFDAEPGRVVSDPDPVCKSNRHCRLLTNQLRTEQLLGFPRTGHG